MLHSFKIPAIVILSFGLTIYLPSCKKEVNLPVVTTTTVTDITQTTALSGGTVTDAGGDMITARGLCWSTSPNPNTGSNKTINLSGSNNFTISITGLIANTKYYLRAYATNSAGTSYGNEVTFTTNDISKSSTIPTVTTADITSIVTSITQIIVVLGGNITSDGGDVVTARGICWSKNPLPTIDDTHTSDGAGSGNFRSVLIDLIPGTITRFYVRAYASNSAGTGYGNEVSFNSNQNISAPTIPTLTTSAVTSITSLSALSGGTITNDGGSDIIDRGISWSTSPDWNISDGDAPLYSNGPGSGSFVSILSNLLQGTTYYVKAFATNSVGTGVGSTLSFTTDNVITESSIISFTSVSAIITINVLYGQYGDHLTGSGICWNTSQNPTTADNKSMNTTYSGFFRINLTDLTPGTTYFVRGYAVYDNSPTVYGKELSFTTSTNFDQIIVFNPYLTYGSISDVDGNIYKTIQIGSQVWMAENLKTTRFNDGTLIPNVTDNLEWSNLTTPGYSWYNNDAGSYKTTFGALYNWYAVSTAKICPTGWHVPTDNELNTLTGYLGNNAGDKMIETGNTHWLSLNTGVTNESGFTGLPGGTRHFYESNNPPYVGFSGIGYSGNWWSATDKGASGGSFQLWWSDDFSYFTQYSRNKIDGQSVRCVKD